MKANGVLDFNINELGCISRDLGVLLWRLKVHLRFFATTPVDLLRPNVTAL
jgi:hypothetical protein